ncbi:hypothetical protein TREMEDRAFT_28815 [Tremella mesenterica DSM 1558]|uniref:uncharacterized protein n=1 Tax=Tremella mesenterica (strain ATCC 24925 / CBS 8224 / DSM 1558 / NBRC 9311 / NRRL Y-6157 / RJB 2259-6 / UBC 559-6) TaxID=578456 RepID=UPI0003F4A2A7|nr:uncharacterized protein TREMEDRAFT_28815 [Tremella mesenterica DSM 1558]EIW70406.1 hypothetical protein TREMEDRAFT_28815 [Tremella mesenterica DSM 1558]
MALPISEEEPDLSHIHWSWPEAIAANPTHSLSTPDLAMDYFAFSPFWDKNSNNNVLRTQRRVEHPTYGHAEEKYELPAFTSGFEYIISHSLPPELFVIHRREVENGKRDRVSAVYFILDGKVYPTPSLYNVLSVRLRNATSLLESSFSTLSSFHPPSNPRINPQWRSLPPPPPPIQPDARTPVDQPDELSANTKSKEEPNKTDWNLFHALSTTHASLDELDEMAQNPISTSEPHDFHNLDDIRNRRDLSLPPSSIVGNTPTPGETPYGMDMRTPTVLASTAISPGSVMSTGS